MRGNLAILCVLSIIGLSSPAESRTIEGVRLEEKTQVLGQDAVLNGAALLEATVLKLDIYVVGLYLKARQTDPEAILKCDSLWMIRMTFLRDIGQSSLRSGWRDAVEGRPELSEGGVRALFDKFIGALPEIHEGDVHALTFDPKAGFSFAVNGKVLFQTKNRVFSRMVIRGYVDPKYTPGGIAPHLLGRPAR